MTLREGVCSNRQSTIIWGEGWPNHHITFKLAKTKLIYSLFCSIYGMCGGKRLVENVIWRGGVWQKMSRIPSYCSKNRHM